MDAKEKAQSESLRLISSWKVIQAQRAVRAGQIRKAKAKVRRLGLLWLWVFSLLGVVAWYASKENELDSKNQELLKLESTLEKQSLELQKIKKYINFDQSRTLDFLKLDRHFTNPP